MGKTYKRNDRWKKDRRDQNFKKSKKFKEFIHGEFTHQKPSPQSQVDIEPTEPSLDEYTT
jgi:hypothetical protein